MRPLLVVLILLSTVLPAMAECVVIEVDISDQKMMISVDDQGLYQWAVSTGRDTYPTPKGSFHPKGTIREYYSRTFANVPSQGTDFYHGHYAVLFRDSYAIHATHKTELLGHRHSFGCIHLTQENAKIVYDLVRGYGFSNTLIVVRD